MLRFSLLNLCVLGMQAIINRKYFKKKKRLKFPYSTLSASIHSTVYVGETGAFLARGNFSQSTFELVNLTLEK